MRKKQKISFCLTEILAIFSISQLVIVLGQTTCNNGQGRVLYERLPNQQLQGFDDDVVRDTAPPFRVLEKCQDLCLRDRTASNNLVRACTSFDFQPGSRIASFSGSAEYEESTCYLTREQAAPEGIGNLMLVPNSVHFTEVCLSSSRPERECPSRRYVFERHPRKKLKLPLSDIKEVTAANRSDCEDKCLNEFSFVCRAANYDSTMRSCTMSRFTRRTHPELLEDDPNSDYLENTCLNAERRCDGLVVYVKEENKRLGGPFEVDIFNNMTLEECQSMCLRAEKYFCRSVEFDDQTKQCILSEEDSISQKDDISISSSPTHHFYDLVCLDNQRGTEYPDNSVTSHLFSNGRRPDTAFQRYRNSRLGGEFHSEITGRSLSECLDECLRQTSFQCRSAVYSDRFRTCRLSRYNQRDGMRIIYDADYDYYENLMHYSINTTVGGDGETTNARPDPTDWRPNTDRDRDRYPDGGGSQGGGGVGGGRYPDDRYPNGGAGGPGGGRYPDDRYPGGSGGGGSGGRYPDDRNPPSGGGGRYPDDRYPGSAGPGAGGGRYPDDRPPNGGSGGPGGGRYPDDRYPTPGRYPSTDGRPVGPGGRPEYGDGNSLGGDRYGDRDRDMMRPTPGGYRPGGREPPYPDRGQMGYGERDRYNQDGYMRPGDRDRAPPPSREYYGNERPIDGMPTKPSLYPDSRFPPDRGQMRPAGDRFRPNYGPGYDREPPDSRYPPDRGFSMRPTGDMYGSGGSYGAGREPNRGYAMRPTGDMYGAGGGYGAGREPPPDRGYGMRPTGDMYGSGGGYAGGYMDHRYHMSSASSYGDRDRYNEYPPERGSMRPSYPPVSSNRFPVGSERYPIDIYKYGNSREPQRERFPPSGSGYDGYGGGSDRDRDYGKDRTYGFTSTSMYGSSGGGGYQPSGYRPPYSAADRDRAYVRPVYSGGGGSGGYPMYEPQRPQLGYDNSINPSNGDGFGGYGPPRPIGGGSRCDESDSYKQVASRHRMRSQYIKRTMTVPTLVHCQRECTESRDFSCRSFNYKEASSNYDNDRDSPNCELSDRDSRELDIQSPVMFDTGSYDFYEKSAGRSGQDGECLDVSQVCNEDGMEFTLRTPEGFIGRIYSYGYYDRCFFRGNGGTVNVLKISGPQGYPECGTQRYGDTMTNIIVVQFSDYVQTGRDKRFNLTCLFRGPGEAVVTSSYIGAGSGSPIPIEYLPAENSMSSKVRLMILYQGRPTTTIAVGDPLTFRLESQDGYNHPATSGDMFATNVIARDPYSGRSVQLIDRHGCPVDTFVFPELGRSRDGDSLEARFNAFKIPESNFLVFEATVRTCRDGCQPAYCPGPSGRSEQSYGRRKRSVNGTIIGEGSVMNITEEETVFKVNGTIAQAIKNDTETNQVLSENEAENEESLAEFPEQVHEMIEVFDSREEMQQDSVARKVISPSESICLSPSEYNGLISSVILLIILLLSITLGAGLAYRRYWKVVIKNRATDRTSPISSFSPSALHHLNMSSTNTQFNGSGHSNISNGSAGRNSGLSIFGNGLQKTFATGNLSRMCQIPVMNPLKSNAKSSEFDDPSEPIYTDPSLFERSRSLRSIAVGQSDEV